MHDLYGHGLGYVGRPVILAGFGPRLGLEEGQVDLNCGPGTTKVYLQEFPWEKCVPDDELETPAVVPEAPPEPEGEPAPEPEPEVLPGKARFLAIDPESGEVVDPDPGAPIKPQAVFFATPTVTAVGTVVGVLAVTGLALLGLGILRTGGK